MKGFKSSDINCLLIQPEFSKLSSLNYVQVCKIVGAKYPVPPLGLMTVAALLPQHWSFRLIDINVESLTDSVFEWADIVCTGGMLSQQRGILSIIDKAHQFGKKVVVGGPDPTSQPQLYKTADYLVLGEGENTIPKLLDDLDKGCEHGVYQSAELADMKIAVVPRFDLIRFSDYMMMGLQFSRGCPYNCEFCNVIELFGRKPRTKTIDQMIAELEALKNLGYRGHVFFVDDNFPGQTSRAKELLRHMADWSKENKFPFYFAAEASINLIDNDDLLQLMRQVDFRYISIGIETVEDEVLRLAQKKQNIKKSVPDIVKKIYRYGIVVDACLIIGFDNETDKTADMMIKCMQDAGICMAMVGTLYALPNTQLSRRLIREERLFDESSRLKETEIDQMSHGLNFETIRPRMRIFQDYIKILQQLYDPVRYYERVTYMALTLRRSNKYKPDMKGTIKMAKAFVKVCVKVGMNKTTALLYWKLLFTILLRNPKALEAALSLATMYIHFARHSRFLINLTRKKIRQLKVTSKYAFAEESQDH